MRFVMFYHSLVSDWNHGNAHFLRGVASDLLQRGHEVSIWEPAGGWSRSNLQAEHGDEPIAEFSSLFPHLRSHVYDPRTFDLDIALDDADVVLVHEWNDPELVWRIGEHHAGDDRYQLFFHDTHHRAVTRPEEMERYELTHYDGVLAFGESLRRRYHEQRPQLRCFTWHEAADEKIFRPAESPQTSGEIVWVGNWGDNERTAELREFLLEPAACLGLTGMVHGVRYPPEAVAELYASGLEYGGWLPNYRVPEVFGKHSVTVHVPRRPYTEALPGIPTIRVFEALSCGIPLVSAPWNDSENLFRAGRDYLVARNKDEMCRVLRMVLDDGSLRAELAAHGRETILKRHTCAHRVDELLEIVSQ